MAFIKGFARFWYDFLIGDDWKIAFAATVVLAIGATIVIGGSYDPQWLTVSIALGIAAAFTAALLVDSRPRR